MKIPKGNQNPYIEEEDTTQWPKEVVQTVTFSDEFVALDQYTELNFYSDGSPNEQSSSQVDTWIHSDTISCFQPFVLFYVDHLAEMQHNTNL